MKKPCATVVLLMLSANASSSLITIEPDDYIAGTCLTGTFLSFDLKTASGSDVFVSDLYSAGYPIPGSFIDSGPIGDRVFSSAPDTNTEWMHSLFSAKLRPENWNQNVDTLIDFYGAGTLVIEFFEPVEYVSILSMERGPDAGYGGGSDPQLFWAFDSNGRLLTEQYEGERISLPVHPDYESEYAPTPLAYSETSFSFSDIGYLVMGGDSEPTTLDRLQFRPAEVPEPSTLALLALGLLAFVRRPQYF